LKSRKCQHNTSDLRLQILNETLTFSIFIRRINLRMKPQFEAIPQQNNASLYAFIQHKKQFDFPLHYHPECELTFILSSSGCRFVGNHFCNFNMNDLILLGPNLPHCWKNSEDYTHGASAIVIQFSEHLLGNEWLNAKEFLAIKNLILQASRGIKFGERCACKLKKLLIELVDMPPFEKLMSFLQILNILAITDDKEILCGHEYPHSDLKTMTHERIDIVYEFVKSNYKQKIQLEQIAAKVHMTKESFSRFFSNIMNKTFFSFVNEYRINIASNMLIETDKSVKEICYAVGYQSFPFFYRQFKKFKISSPQKYRVEFQRILSIPLPNNLHTILT
jgi:AraC-like DNA-binding protein